MANNGEQSRPVGQMLVSVASGRTVTIDASKVATGSYFTTANTWMNLPVRNFLETAFASCKSVLDPFAGDGHLLTLVSAEFDVAASGFDIQGGRWPENDSLLAVPNPERAVIVTNPPYLANHSAKRKGVHSLAAPYFEAGRDNLYKVALDNCLAAADYVVAIIPETFLHSGYPTDRLVLATVIEDALFADTDAPAVVACFGPESGVGLGQAAQIYLNDSLVGSLNQLHELRLESQARSPRRRIQFNVAHGRVGLRAVDGTKAGERIRFMPGDEFDYSREAIKVSSRLMTYLELPEVSDADLPAVIARANAVLETLRAESQDLVLAPFKGNNNNGRRRRRLDYEMARRLLVQVLDAPKK